MTEFAGLFSFYSNIRKGKKKVVPFFVTNFTILTLPNDYKIDLGEAKQC